MYIFFNNKYYQDTAILTTESKAFRYGELVFETMRLRNGRILFFEQHFKRLQNAAAVLHIHFPKLFTLPILQKHILATAQKNNLLNARIRVTLFKGNGGLFEIDEDAFNVLIETYTIATDNYEWNSNGLCLCSYTDIKKPLDILSKYKTGNHLLYRLAANFAKKNHCNEALVFNQNNTVADTTISNIFIIKNENAYTPPIQDGGIAGIMRQYVTSIFSNIIEKSITIEEVLAADGVFLTNSIKGIQWVRQVDDVVFKPDAVAPYFTIFNNSIIDL